MIYFNGIKVDPYGIKLAYYNGQLVYSEYYPSGTIFLNQGNNLFNINLKKLNPNCKMTCSARQDGNRVDDIYEFNRNQFKTGSTVNSKGGSNMKLTVNQKGNQVQVTDNFEWTIKNITIK